MRKRMENSDDKKNKHKIPPSEIASLDFLSLPEMRKYFRYVISYHILLKCIKSCKVHFYTRIYGTFVQEPRSDFPFINSKNLYLLKMRHI